MKTTCYALLLPLVAIKASSAKQALRGTQSYLSLTEDDEVGAVETTNFDIAPINVVNGTAVMPIHAEDAAAHRELISAGVFENAQRAVVQRDHNLCEIEIVHANSNLCNPTGQLITSKFTGEVASDGSITWNQITNGDSFCGSRATVNNENFIRNYLGYKGISPAAFRLPTNVNMRKFTLRHSDPALCDIQWNYMRTELAGSGHTCTTDPSQHVWTRWNKHAKYFGSCDAEATGVALPLKYDFYTYTKHSHHISSLCWGPGMPGVTSVWVGTSCIQQEYMQWDRMTTPAPNDSNPACSSNVHWDRSDAGWQGSTGWMGWCGFHQPSVSSEMCQTESLSRE